MPGSYVNFGYGWSAARDSLHFAGIGNRIGSSVYEGMGKVGRRLQRELFPQERVLVVCSPINRQIVGQQQDSANAYQRALDTLPNDNLTPAEARQKSQYEDGLKKAQELLNAPRQPMEKNPLALQVDTTLKITPWDAANDILPK